jgi:hypothetical protein
MLLMPFFYNFKMSKVGNYFGNLKSILFVRSYKK